MNVAVRLIIALNGALAAFATVWSPDGMPWWWRLLTVTGTVIAVWLLSSPAVSPEQQEGP